MIVNGNEMKFTEGLTVASLVDDLGLNPNQVVVEVDLEIIERDEYTVKKLSSDSKVEIIRFVGGG